MLQTLTHLNKFDCALIMALKIGREREKMQVLLLRGLRRTLDAATAGEATIWTRYEEGKSD